MAEINARDVQALRRATGAGMLDCKAALEACGGDLEKAKLWLREKGLASAAKRAERDQDQGAVALGAEGGTAALVELRCETDFVAKSPDFANLASDLAQAVATKGAEAVSGLQHEVEDLGIVLKEHITVGRIARFEPPPGAVVGSYLHMQTDRGVNGVLVEVQGGDEPLAHDVAVHVAFARPLYLSREDVLSQEVDAERATLEAISRNEGKPESALAKIVEGRLGAWFKERCLLEQPYVRDEKKTISQLLGKASITRFVQVVVGT